MAITEGLSLGMLETYKEHIFPGFHFLQQELIYLYPSTENLISPTVFRNKAGHYILTEGSIQQNDKTILNVYALRAESLHSYSVIFLG